MLPITGYTAGKQVRYVFLPHLVVGANNSVTDNMSYISETQPPLVWDSPSLLKSRNELLRQEPVLLAVDYENACLPGQGINQFEKMSELGVAFFDTRIRPSSDDGGQKTEMSTSKSRLERLGRCIDTEHVITEEFRNQTEETCEAGHHNGAHIDPGCAHIPRPYHCRFVDSKFLNKAQTMEHLADIIKKVSTQNLTDEEKAAGITRNIKIIAWDSHCEESTFYHGGLDLLSLCPRASIELWDFQVWYPFRARFHANPNSKNARTRGERTFSSLGVLGTGLPLPLHNGCNV